MDCLKKKQPVICEPLSVPWYPYQKVSHLHGHRKKIVDPFVCYEISLGALYVASLI